MNDSLIIIICIFLMTIVWRFYFKLKEGIDNTDNYVMPISFSNNSSTDPSRDESKTISVPGQITTKDDLKLMKNTTVQGTLNVKGDTTLDGNVRGEIKMPIYVPLHFGVGQNKEVNAGKIAYGTWDSPDLLSIVGGGGAGGYPNDPRKVKIWDHLIVEQSINVGKSQDIFGVQSGNAVISGHNSRVNFPKEFSGDEVVVVVNPATTTGNWNSNFMVNVIDSNKAGFNVTITGVATRPDSVLTSWQPRDVMINWVAFCKGKNKISYGAVSAPSPSLPFIKPVRRIFRRVRNAFRPPPPPPPLRQVARNIGNSIRRLFGRR